MLIVDWYDSGSRVLSHMSGSPPCSIIFQVSSRKPLLQMMVNNYEAVNITVPLLDGSSRLWQPCLRS